MRLSAIAGVRLGSAAVALALAGAVAGGNGWAQEIVHATGPLPSFEVATVKLTNPNAGVVSAALVAEGAATGGLGVASGGGAGTTAAGEKITRQTTVSVFFGDAPLSDRVRMSWKVKSLIAKAYGLPLSAESRVVGGPVWINSEADRYEVQAKIDDAEFTALQKMASAEQGRQVALMEQALLADRFKLAVHFETRDLPVYELVVAKGGSKMAVAKPDEVVPHLTGVGDGQNNTLTAQAMTMDQFVHSPLLRPGRMVIDRTGLTGAYDFTLKSSIGADPGADGPSLFTGIEEQLGLKLVAAKAPLEVIVVDHIERPGEN